MRTVILLFSVVCFACIAHSQWIPTNGPYGGRTNCFAHNENVVFAGTSCGGVFVSDNYGASRQKRNNGFADLGPSGLMVGALYADNEVAFAGIGVNGFYRSYDEGLNWEVMPGFWASYALTAIARTDNHLFVGTAGGGLQRSEDNGATWMPAMNGVMPALYHAVSVVLVKAPYVFFSGQWQNVSFR